MSQDQITKVALAIRDAAQGFQRPVNFYVEGEARHRFEVTNPNLDPDDDSSVDDWYIESWRILARAALAALSN